VPALTPAPTEAPTPTPEPIQSDRWLHSEMTCSVGEEVWTTKTMTYDDYDRVANSIKSLYDSLPSTCTSTICPQADWTGCILRAAGHDFMDFTGSQGGSDGCLDLHDVDNKGLHECLYKGEFGVSLNDAYKHEHCAKMSLADFLVIAAETVMEITRSNVPGASPVNFRSRFRYGRTTSVTCEWATDRLPQPGIKKITAVQQWKGSLSTTWASIGTKLPH
jgi:hypothetical protein